MRNHILGFSDELGASPSVLLFGTENGVTNNYAEMARISEGDWPDDIIRVELHNDDQGLERIAVNQNPTSKTQKKMKFKSSQSVISSLVGLIGFLLGASTFAQTEPVYYVDTIFSWIGEVGITNGGSNYYTPGAAWGIPTSQTTNGVIDCRKSPLVAYGLQFNSNTNVAMTNWLCWVPSIDSVKWDYTNAVKHQFTFVPAAAGGSTYQITNFMGNGLISAGNGMPGVGYYKLYWMSNDCVGWGAGGVVQITNIVIKAAIKIQ